MSAAIERAPPPRAFSSGRWPPSACSARDAERCAPARPPARARRPRAATRRSPRRAARATSRAGVGAHGLPQVEARHRLAVAASTAGPLGARAPPTRRARAASARRPCAPAATPSPGCSVDLRRRRRSARRPGRAPARGSRLTGWLLRQARLKATSRSSGESASSAPASASASRPSVSVPVLSKSTLRTRGEPVEQVRRCGRRSRARRRRACASS